MAILRLLERGHVVDALGLQELPLTDAAERLRSGSGGDEAAAAARIDAYVDAALARGAPAGGHDDGKPTAHVHDAQRHAVVAFFKRMPAHKCEQCGCHVPALRREAGGKIFRSRLSARQQRANQEMGARTGTTALFADAEADAAAARAKKDGADTAPGPRPDGMDADSEDEEEEEDQDDDEMGALAADAFGEADAIVPSPAPATAPTGTPRGPVVSCAVCRS
jgi:hypothetical protein